jgi:hypothetical protein
MIRGKPSLLKRSNRYAYSRLVITFWLLAMSSLLLLQPIGVVFKLLLETANGFMVPVFLDDELLLSKNIPYPKNINRRVGEFMTSVILVNFSAYKLFHMHHHLQQRSSSTPGRSARSVKSSSTSSAPCIGTTLRLSRGCRSVVSLVNFFVRGEKLVKR